VQIVDAYTATGRQAEFHRNPAKYRGYGGAMTGGKSFGGCADDFRLSWQFPGNRGVIVRKNMTTLKRTVLRTFFRVIPSDLIEDYNKQEMKVNLINGSEILFMEADVSKDPLFDKFKSLEIGWFHMEEASEIDRAAFQILATRLRWILPDGSYPHFSGIITTNPEDCWIKEDFIDKPLAQTAFIPALPSDNPHLPPGHIDELRDILTLDQQSRYLDGDWSITDKPDQLISFQWIQDACGTIEDIDGTENTLGVDVARFGDDSSQIAHMLANALINLKSFKKLRTDQLADKVEKEMKIYDIDPRKVGVDVIGLGAGTVDSLRRRKIKVKEINSSAKAPKYGKFRFKNFRSYMWWLLREDLRKGDIVILVEDKQLIQELTAVRFSITPDGMIMIEPKKETKKRLRRSPDKGDAFVYANAMRHNWNEKTVFNYISLGKRRNWRR
jgi:phage terminase large subunit